MRWLPLGSNAETLVPDPFSFPGRGRPIWRWEARSQRRILPSLAEVASVLLAGSNAAEVTKLGCGSRPTSLRVATSRDRDLSFADAAGGKPGAVAGERHALDVAGICWQRRELPPVGGSPEEDPALPAPRGHGAAVRLQPTGRFGHFVQIVKLRRACLAILAGSRNHTIPADRRPIWVLAVMTHDRSRANVEGVLDQLILILQPRLRWTSLSASP
jgi:hypothetical protein